MTSSNSSPSLGTPDWASEAWRLAGYAVALGFLALPVVALLWFMRTRRWRERRRVFYAGEKPVWWRDAMDRLPPPFGDWPPKRKRRRDR